MEDNNIQKKNTLIIIVFLTRKQVTKFYCLLKFIYVYIIVVL